MKKLGSPCSSMVSAGVDDGVAEGLETTTAADDFER